MFVDKILVEKGEAVGVKLLDGTKIMSKKSVITNSNPVSTFIDMVGEEHLDEAFGTRIL